MKTRYFDNVISQYSHIKNVIIYLRKSRLIKGTKKEKEENLDLEVHRNRLESIAKYYNWNYKILEEVESGEALENRPVMKSVLEEISDYQTDAILAYATDRLGRGEDLFPMGSKFKQTKTLLMLFNTRQILDLSDLSQKQLYDFQSFMAMQELALIKQRLSDGKMESMESGNWVYGRPPMPYRYNRESKNLDIDEKEQEIYLEIIEKFLDGENYTQICNWLNNQTDIPSPRKKTWSGKTVKKLLLSTVHLGFFEIKGEGNIGKGNYRPLPKAEWREYKGNWKPLKDISIHNQVIAEVERIGRSNNPNGRKTHSLSNLVYCGCCGKRLNIHLNNKNELVIRNCKVQNTNEQCGNMGGKAQIIEEEIVTLLEKHLAHFKFTKNNVGYEKEIERKQLHLEKINEELNSIESSIMNVMNIIVSNVDERDKAYAQKMKANFYLKQEELEKEKEIVKGQLEKIIVKSQQNKGEILENAIKDLRDFKTSEHKNKIYKSVVQKIYWKRTKENPYDLMLQIHII